MDYEFDAGEIVTIVNRTKRVLDVTFNGRTVAKLQPGPNALNAVFARHAFRRFPIPGTFDPTYEHQHDALVGVEEWGQPVSEIDESKFAHIKESIDRSKLPADRQHVELQKVGWGVDDAVKGEKSGEQNVGAMAGRAPLVENGAFGIQPV